MPKTHSGWSRDDPYVPRSQGFFRLFGGRAANDRLFQNETIDKWLKRGRSAKDIKRALEKEMGELSKRDKEKIMRRVDTRANKANQGKKK